MQYRTLGKTGWRISAISMGCWALGNDYGEIPDQQADEAVHAALDAGVNFFDTADGYGMGLSEQRLGRALGRVRDQNFIATKVGNWARQKGHPLPFTHPSHVIGCCHASLYRLGTDHIDLYQCHRGRPEHPEVYLEAFDRLQEQGKIRAWGISTDHVDALRHFNESGNCAACQAGYHLLRRGAEAELLPYCQAQDIGVLVRVPLAKGVLAGKFTADSQFTDRSRKGFSDGKREQFLKQVEQADQLRFLQTPRRSMAQAALAFLLAHDAVTAPIPGMKTPEQARANAAAADATLSADELTRIDAVCPAP